MRYLDVSDLATLAESAMITPARLIRPTGDTYDPVTNTHAKTGQLLWQAYCYLRRPGLEVRFGETAAALVPIQGYVVHVPAAAGPFGAGDFLQTLNEDGEPDRTFIIQGAGAESWQVHQTLQVTEVPTFPITIT